MEVPERLNRAAQEAAPGHIIIFEESASLHALHVCLAGDWWHCAIKGKSDRAVAAVIEAAINHVTACDPGAAEVLRRLRASLN